MRKKFVTTCWISFPLQHFSARPGYWHYVSYTLSLYIQAADKVKLKICANSTRRALWHARLGFHSNPRPPIMSLHSLFADGGPIPGVDIVVVRIYPIQVRFKLQCCR